MGTRKIEKGPSSDRVAANIRTLRADRRLTLAELSARLTKLGRPILTSGLSKIEAGERKVDVDDLTALAMALEVTPNRLLLDAEADEHPIKLTEDYETNRAQSWAWACGGWINGSPFPFTRFSEEPLFERGFRFEAENRPHDPPRRMSLAEWDELRPWQEALGEVYWAMSNAGLPAWMYHELLKSRRYHEAAAHKHEDSDDGQR